MRSRTYNAIITKSYEAIDTLFFPKNRVRASLDNFLKTPDRKDLLVLSPAGGHGFIELDVNFPTRDRAKYISLKMVDSAQVSEFFVTDRHPVDNLAVSRVEKAQSFVSGAPVDAFKDLEKRGNRFYLAFGVGDDIRTWSGPYTIHLTDANLNITSDGVREIEYMFTPQLETIRGFTGILTNDAEYGQLESRFDSKTIKQPEITVNSDIAFEARTGNKIPKPGYQEAPQPVWNYWTRALVSKYISNMFPSIPFRNILVLFSTNMDAKGEDALIDLNSYADATMLDHEDNLGKLGIGIAPLEETSDALMSLDPTKSTILQNITGSSDGSVGSLGPLPPFDGNRQELLDQGVPADRLTTPEEEERAKREGIDYAKRLTPEQRKALGFAREDDIKSTDAIREEIIRGKPYLINPDSTRETDKGVGKGKYKLTMTKSWDYKKGNSRRFDTILEPLIKFFRGLRDKRKKNLEFTLFEENDMKILKFLENNGIIANSKFPVVVFGEKELIQQLLYPKKPFTANPKPMNSDEGLGSALTFLTEKDFKSYSEEFCKEFYTLRNRTSSFGERVDLGPLSKSLKDNFTSEDLVFMHNVKNSNVLDVNFKNEGYKASVLALAADSKDVLQAQAARQALVLKDNEVKYKKVIQYLKAVLNIAKDDVPQDRRADIIQLLKKDVYLSNLVWDYNEGEENAQSWIETINFLVTGHEFTSPGPKVKVNPGERHKAYSDMLEDLNKLTITANIKTLPFFNHPQLFERNCFLFGLQNEILGSVNSNDALYSVFTGRYKIIGVRHYMSSDNAFSEFDLRRNDLVQLEEGLGRDFSRMLLKDIMKPLGTPASVAAPAIAARQRTEGLIDRILGFFNPFK